nr:unnamed protein product [Digitaria exilis]
MHAGSFAEMRKGYLSGPGKKADLLLTAITQLVHHGMIFVPVGYTVAGMFEMEPAPLLGRDPRSLLRAAASFPPGEILCWDRQEAQGFCTSA